MANLTPAQQAQAEKIRRDMAFAICSKVNGVPETCKLDSCPHCTFVLPRLEESIDSILSLEGLAIVDEDQSADLSNLVNTGSTEPIYFRTFRLMEAQGFKKVLPKGDK